MRSHIFLILLFFNFSFISFSGLSSQLARASLLHNNDMWAVVVIVLCFIFWEISLISYESHWLFAAAAAFITDYSISFIKIFSFVCPFNDLRQHIELWWTLPSSVWMSQELVLRKHSLFTCNISHKFVKLIHSGFWLNGSLHSSVRNSKRRQAGTHTRHIKPVSRVWRNFHKIRFAQRAYRCHLTCAGERDVKGHHEQANDRHGRGQHTPMWAIAMRFCYVCHERPDIADGFFRVLQAAATTTTRRERWLRWRVEGRFEARLGEALTFGCQHCSTTRKEINHRKKKSEMIMSMTMNWKIIFDISIAWRRCDDCWTLFFFLVFGSRRVFIRESSNSISSMIFFRATTSRWIIQFQ